MIRTGSILPRRWIDVGNNENENEGRRTKTNRCQTESHPSSLEDGRGVNRWSSESSVNSFRHYRVVTEEDKVNYTNLTNSEKRSSRLEGLVSLMKWLCAGILLVIVLLITVKVIWRRGS